MVEYSWFETTKLITTDQSLFQTFDTKYPSKTKYCIQYTNDSGEIVVEILTSQRHPKSGKKILKDVEDTRDSMQGSFVCAVL